MATLNHIMPDKLKEGFCERKEKQPKNPHAWLPSGQTRAIVGDQIALECYCRHCNLREWTRTSRVEFGMLQDYWKELR
jgi:hypothetical protein